jgi:hypothetical protein
VNDATSWRDRLAQRIADAYAAEANSVVVMVAGSVGRGVADAYSDIEVDVYYARPPTESERAAAVERSGGTLVRLAEDEDEWEEQISFGGFPAASSTFTVVTMERYLREVVEECRIAPEAQTRLFSMQAGRVVKGEEQAERWRTRAAEYPDGLRQVMLEANLGFERFRYAGEMLAVRDDLLALYDVLVETGRQLLSALLGLNRMYLPAPDVLKGMDETIERLSLAPPNLSARLNEAFRAAPEPAIRRMKELISETLDLVAEHAPAFDTTPYRSERAVRRRPWNEAPAD